MHQEGPGQRVGINIRSHDSREVKLGKLLNRFQQVFVGGEAFLFSRLLDLAEPRFRSIFQAELAFSTLENGAVELDAGLRAVWQRALCEKRLFGPQDVRERFPGGSFSRVEESPNRCDCDERPADETSSTHHS
jgi:hypothetical protein